MVAYVDPLPAVRAYLLADAGVQAASGGRVYVGRLPRAETSSMPRKCAVISLAGGPGNRGMVRLHSSRIDTRSYGANDKEAAALYWAIRAALQEMPRHVTAGVLLQSATVENGPVQLDEPEVDWPLVFGSYLITANEEAAA